MKLSEKQLKALAEFLPDCNLYYVELRKYCDGIREYHDTKAEGRDKLIWRVKIRCGTAYNTYEDIEGAVHWLLSNDGQAALMDKLDSEGVTCGFIPQMGPNYCITMDDGIYKDTRFGGTRQEALINAVLAMSGVEE